MSHETVGRWVVVLERLYAVYRIPPFGAPRLRAVRKEQKHYHFDWSLVPEPGPRFENLVASCPLEWVHHQQDTEGRELEPRHFRDVDRREVDLVVTEEGRATLLVECKWADAEVARPLRYLKARLPGAEAWQISATGRKDHVTAEGIRVAPAWRLLGTLV